MRLRTLRIVGLAILSSAGLLAQGQGERPQFRAGVELLQLDVAVLDNKRQPVSGLTAADFTVLDNGVETPIRAFTSIELARPRANEAVWAGDVAPDVVTNQVGDAEGRLVIILLDPTIPLEEPTVTARKIATAAVESLGPHDLAAVVSTNNSAVQTRAVQNLTADRARLLAAINAADPSVAMSATAEGIMNMPGSPFKDRSAERFPLPVRTLRARSNYGRSRGRARHAAAAKGAAFHRQQHDLASAPSDRGRFPGRRVRDAARGCARRHVRGHRSCEPDRALHRSTRPRQRGAAVTGVGD